jgi:phosphoserine phosphatase RsbU/P
MSAATALVLLMAGVRAVLRTLTRSHNGSGERHYDPGDLLTTTNEIVSPDLNDRFISLLYASIHPQSRKLRYASAGQPAYLLDSEGNVKKLLDSTASPLGVIDERIEASPEIVLAHGDLLVMYTDGITESEGSDRLPFGEERMLKVVRESRHLPANRIVDNVFASAEAYSKQAAQHDDMTLVIVKVTSPN